MNLTELLESSLYVTDIEAAEEFYTEILGLELHAKAPDRHLFFQCGRRMLLLFNASVTTHPLDGSQDAPAHGAEGAGHVAFAVRDLEIDGWKEHLSARGVTIEKEIEWQGSRSIYFRDPSGNSLEITSPGIWDLGEDHLP